MRQSHSIAGRIAAASLILAGVVAGTAIVSSELASAADAARRVPRSTHLGVPVSDFVTLRWVDETTSPKFVRVNSDATQDTTEFVVPDGRALVLTDYDIYGEWKDTGDPMAMRFWVEDATTASRVVGATVAVTSPRTTTSSAGIGYTGYDSSTFTTGVVLGPGTKLRFDAIAARILDRDYTDDGIWPENQQRDFEVAVRGYLTSAE